MYLLGCVGGCPHSACPALPGIEIAEFDRRVAAERNGPDEKFSGERSGRGWETFSGREGFIGGLARSGMAVIIGRDTG